MGRLKHILHRCKGPVERVNYFPPRQVEVSGMGAEQLIDEAMYGVTLCHCRCARCGDLFTNRELGDRRDLAPKDSD